MSDDEVSEFNLSVEDLESYSWQEVLELEPKKECFAYWSALLRAASTAKSGKFQINESGSATSTFANVVAVSFSAFDDSDFLADRKQEGSSLGFSYIGLKGRSRESSRARPKSPKALAEDFVKSLRLCRIGARAKRWRDVISILESDPIFKSIQIKSVIDADLDDEDARSRVLKIFNLLSSGHKIVLLTLTRLVEKVEERTLVLIDEPEGHLHPPLLSAMTRAISRLLVQRNGVAIIATHSPVILQEVGNQIPAVKFLEVCLLRWGGAGLLKLFGARESGATS